MRFSVSSFGKVGRVLKKDDVYTVIDVSKLDRLVVSMTVLHPGKETKGHSHADADEVYFFIEGSGKMKVGTKKFAVKKDDIILIKRGLFHRVFNVSKKELKFVCVFEKYGDRA